MRIRWEIKKTQGNIRPTLSYTMELEEFERELAVDAVNIQSLIPKVEKPGQMYCMPGTFERGQAWEPRDYHWLTAPHFKTGSRTETIKLPFRRSNHYPEVDQSFELLRLEHEEAVQQALGCSPISIQGELDFTAGTRKNIAGAVARKKFEMFLSPHQSAI